MSDAHTAAADASSFFNDVTPSIASPFDLQVQAQQQASELSNVIQSLATTP